MKNKNDDIYIQKWNQKKKELKAKERAERLQERAERLQERAERWRKRKKKTVSFIKNMLFCMKVGLEFLENNYKILLLAFGIFEYRMVSRKLNQIDTKVDTQIEQVGASMKKMEEQEKVKETSIFLKLYILKNLLIIFLILLSFSCS